MPELPEVETARRNVERALKGKRIVRVEADPKDRLAFHRDGARAVKKALQGARITGTGRRGKYFWLKLDRKPWVIIHLGMSGNVEIRGRGDFAKAWGGITLWSQRNKKREMSARPRYCRLLLETSDGTAVAITDPRRFGRIRLAEDPLRDSSVARLGADPLEDFPSAKDLGKIFAKRKGPIKALLLDQALFAGVGNWLADEILFQARISPHRKVNELSAAEVQRLRRFMLAIIRKAVSVNADYERFPTAWLFHDRWGRKKEAYHSHGYEIRHDTIGGRTTAWVPALQS